MDSSLLEAYLAGELDDLTRGQVEIVLLRDAELRTTFLQQMRMDAALRVILGAAATASVEVPVSEETFCNGVLAHLRSEGAGDTRSFAKSVLTEIVVEREGKRLIRWPDLVIAGAVSAAASIGLMFVLQNIDVHSQARSTARPFVARFESGGDGGAAPRWSGEGPGGIHADGWMPTGEYLLGEGRALIAFNSGATALLEGPARFRLESSNRIFLHQGRLVSEVPVPAQGFTVNTPSLTAVDLGTRFGITVATGGNSELHVMEGLVAASRSSGNTTSILVREGNAVQADNRTRSPLQEIPYAGDGFILQASSGPPAEPVLRYNFDESGGAILENSGQDRYRELSLVPEGDSLQPPKRTAGRIGGGLVFQAGQSLTIPLGSLVDLSQAHTLAFWCKLRPDPVADQGREMRLFACSQGALSAGAHCRYGSNTAPSSGTPGGLTMRVGSAALTGGTDITDGNWHHLAFRFVGGENAAMGSHFQLFVDGQLETTSAIIPGRVHFPPAAAIVFGAASTDGLQGWIDDLVIYGQAISTTALQKLAAEPPQRLDSSR
jgi:Concanavalin A-like lectin/glucanases superfamily/FecR protein